jgi:hypothetical protein
MKGRKSVELKRKVQTGAFVVFLFLYSRFLSQSGYNIRWTLYGRKSCLWTLIPAFICPFEFPCTMTMSIARIL